MLKSKLRDTNLYKLYVADLSFKLTTGTCFSMQHQIMAHEGEHESSVRFA